MGNRLLLSLFLLLVLVCGSPLAAEKAPALQNSAVEQALQVERLARLQEQV